MAGQVCRTALQGYPVQVTGLSALLDKESLVIPNEIVLQLDPTNIQMRYDRGKLNVYGSNTFTIGPNQYNVAAVILASPKQEGLASYSGATIAEFQIWGVPLNNSQESYTLAVLIVPLRQGNESNEGNNIFKAVTGAPVQLGTCIPSGENVDVIRYDTCIETDKSANATIKVAYWTKGVSLTQTMVNRLPVTKTPAGTIPNIMPYKILSPGFEQSNDSAQTKLNRRYDIVEPNMLVPYQMGSPISASSQTFRDSFCIIRNFTRGDTKQVSKFATDNYKCVPIHTGKDIKDGILTVDPLTGKTLTAEAVQIEKQKFGIQDIEKPKTGGIGSNTIWITICAILGVIIGIGIIAAILIFLKGKMFSTEDIATAATGPISSVGTTGVGVGTVATNVATTVTTAASTIASGVKSAAKTVGDAVEQGSKIVAASTGIIEEAANTVASPIVGAGTGVVEEAVNAGVKGVTNTLRTNVKNAVKNTLKKAAPYLRNE
jgi:hypothetical protein